MRIFNFLFTATLIFGLASCYPQGPEYIDELDLFISDRAATYDFGNKKVYYLYDTVNWVTNDPLYKPDRSFDREMINRVASIMDSRNYVRMDTVPDTTNIDNPQNPDLFMSVTGIHNTSSGTVWYPVGGWGWGWGWGGGWGGWFPSSYTYTTGTIIIDMGDVKTGSEVSKTLPLVWEGAVNGLAGSRPATDQQRILNGIDQVFEQSPYILSNL